MKLWAGHAVAIGRKRLISRHEFVIGPLCDTTPSYRKGRLYYCRLCEWRFLVCGSKVAVLDEDGNPLIGGGESLRRFGTSEEGPCPVLEAFASQALSQGENFAPLIWRKYDERSSVAPRTISIGSARPRPILRVLTGLRENLGRQA
jgi:hypothetical protein